MAPRRPPLLSFVVERRNVRRAVLSDLYHVLIDRDWTRLLGLLAAFYTVANLTFACLYMLGGDCISGAVSFRDHFFFSVHTLSTIGYGTMAPRTTYANVLVAIQAFLGTLFLAVTTGLVFAKFSRPTARVMWSSKAIIVERDGKKLLMFRMANERANQIVEATLRAAVARTEVTSDGERMRRFQDLTLERDRNIVFVLSWTAMHVIDEKSPLYGLTVEAMKAQSLQLICSLVGTDETFSQQVHSRNSYNPEDFVWDQRFADIIGTNPDGTRYVDYALFHDLVPMGTKTETV
ncbi:MAG: Kef-type transport system protein [Myxococcales bacterium]|nr:Kef-type transport system protein [Myxococcales bacterium]